MIRQVQEPECRRCELCGIGGDMLHHTGWGPLFFVELLRDQILCRKCLELLQEELKDWKP